MFQYIIGGIAALAFGAIAVKELTKTTGEKVKDGDDVFVHADAIQVLTPAGTVPNPVNGASLKAFLAGFLTTSIKVSAARLEAPPSTRITGTILGFPSIVVFDRSAVASIERNGARIT